MGYDGTRPFRLLITGGGTGGHLFPAVASAQALKARQPDSEILFVGTRRRMDTTALGQYGFTSEAIDSYGLKGKNPLELVKALAVLPLSVAQAMRHILRFRPDVALGVGGYVTGPVMVAARLLGVPTIIHEQNSIPGLANRKLGGLVGKICVSLPGSQAYFPAAKTVLTGNPVRQDILALASQPDLPEDNRTLLVLGGSQGAHMVNRLVTDAVCDRVSGTMTGIEVIHQTGNADEEWVRERYIQAGVKATVSAFFRDMAAMYSRAGLLVSRAGATTLSEIAVLGKPAILIPYPHAADNHQRSNGDYYVKGGGALQFIEAELTSGVLAENLAQLFADGPRRAAMGVAMRQLGIADAAERIVDSCLAAARNT